MKRFVFGRFLVILALAGLLLVPIGEAIAGPAMPAVLTAGMAVDMDCCPKQHTPQNDCGKTCPFVALCLTSLSGLAAAEILFTPRVIASQSLRPGREFQLASLASKPPSRPPRI